MKLKPVRWGLAGGVLGLMVGLFLVALRHLEPPAPVAETPRLPALAPTGQYGDSAPTSDGQQVLLQVQELLGDMAESAPSGKLLETIQAIGDGGTGQPDFEDQNLAWLVERMVNPDRDVEENLDSAPAADQDQDASPQGKRPSPFSGSAGTIQGETRPSSPSAPSQRPGAMESGSPHDPIDFALAEKIAALIRAPLARAHALSKIGQAHLSEGPDGREAADDAVRRAIDAIKRMGEKPPATTESHAGLTLYRDGLWTIGLGLIGLVAFGLVAQGLNAFGDRVAAGLAEEIDREAAARHATAHAGDVPDADKSTLPV